MAISSNDVMTNEYAYIGRGVQGLRIGWSRPLPVEGTRQF